MIQGLSAGYGIHINNGYFGGPYIDQTRYDAGRLRMIGNTMEVYNGSSWCPVTNGPTHVELSSEVVAILEWARQKKNREEKLKSVAAEYPAVKLLQDQITDLQDKLEVVLILVDEHQAS
jgi:hypothetical protein